MNLTERWARLTPHALTAADFMSDGAALADSGGNLILVDREGTVVAEHVFPGPVHSLSVSRDGSTVALACGEGFVAMLCRGKVQYRKSPDPSVRLVKAGPHGDYVVAADLRGRGWFLNRFGRPMGEFLVPGGLDSMAVVPASGLIVASKHDGVVNCLSAWGKPLWRMELSRGAGPPATDLSGETILIPVLAFGVEALTSAGTSIGTYDVGEPVRRVACSGDGQRIVATTMENRLVLMDRSATILFAEVFPSKIAEVALSGGGDRLLVTTASGYAHLMEVTDGQGAPLLELGDRLTTGGGPRPIVKRQVFSPHSMLLQARLAFSPDGRRLALSGDRQRIQVMDVEGRDLARRRFTGSLLDLAMNADGEVRVFSSKGVFTFRPGTDGATTEWAEPVDLAKVVLTGHDTATGVTDDGEVVRFLPPGRAPERPFFIDSPYIGDLAAAPGSVAASLRSGEVVIHADAGAEIGRSGPWPVTPRILAASDLGYLLSVEKLLLLIGVDGAERWRQPLETRMKTGVAVPGSFVAMDEAGTVFVVTGGGVVRETFRAKPGILVPFPDGGEGPGFLLADGPQLTAVHPDGRARWRFRAGDDISCTKASPDGRFVALVAGIELIILPLVGKAMAAERHAERTSYLEFADG